MAAGIGLFVSIFIPVLFEPDALFVWHSPHPFQDLVWPLLAGLVFIFASRARDGQWFSPGRLQGLAFVTAFAAFLLIDRFFALQDHPASQWLFRAGYPLLLGSLRAIRVEECARLVRPLLLVSALVLAGGLVVDIYDAVSTGPDMERFQLGYTLVQGCMVALILGLAIVAMTSPRVAKWTAIIVIVWMVLEALYVPAVYLFRFDLGVVNALFMTGHSIIEVLVYTGVVVITAPTVFEQLQWWLRRSREGHANQGTPVEIPESPAPPADEASAPEPREQEVEPGTSDVPDESEMQPSSPATSAPETLSPEDTPADPPREG